MSNEFDKAIQAISSKTGTTKRGYLTVEMDLAGVRAELADADKAVKQTVTDKDLLDDLAWTLINITEEDELIPYKTKYKIRKPQNTNPNEPNYRKDIKQHAIKRGKNKGKLINDKFHPSQYYSYEELKYQKPTINIYSDAYGREQTMYAEPAKTRKRVYWQQVDHNPVYGKSFARGLREYKGRKEQIYYSDRPPHLNDVLDTHRVVVKGGNAQITIHNRKPKDERFSEVGGTEYALAQYFGDDSNWNREREDSTSRWLEVAVGLVQPSRPVTTDVDMNLKQLTVIMNKYLSKRLGGKKK